MVIVEAFKHLFHDVAKPCNHADSSDAHANFVDVGLSHDRPLARQAAKPYDQYIPFETMLAANRLCLPMLRRLPRPQLCSLDTQKL